MTKLTSLREKKVLFCILFNFIFIAIIFSFTFIARFLPRLFFVGIIAKAILFLVLEILAFAIHNFFYSKGKSFFYSLKEIFTQGFLLAILKFAIYISLLYSFRFCFKKESILFYIFGILVLWLFFLFHFSLLWFFAVYEKKEKFNFLLNLKKSIKFFFDNPSDTAILFLKNIFVIIISVITVFLYPGITGAILNIKTPVKKS